MEMPSSAFNCRASTHRIRLISRFRNEVDENPESCDSVEPVLVSDPRITFANLAGIIIFADDTLAAGFYALPAQPRLARDDGDSSDANPADDTQAGRDFWFTRNGHDAGFWDRPTHYYGPFADNHPHGHQWQKNQGCNRKRRRNRP